MFDFANIVGGIGGQREGFEALICQIARRMAPHRKAEFRRVHGAGGDGGVEAVWVLPDGSEHGFQAKFHLKSADVDWAAIDESVAAALSTHPRLTRYTIAIATDLTGQVRGRGRSGWDHWARHKSGWEADARAHLGRDVEFIPWMASDLEDLLLRPEMRGIADFFLGALDVSDQWVRAQYARTVDALEERYHPEDHVEVGASQIFDGLARNEAWRARLKTTAKAVYSRSLPSQLPEDVGRKTRELDARLRDGVAGQAEAQNEVGLPPYRPFPTQAWRKRADLIRETAYDLSMVLRDERDLYSERKADELASAASASEEEPPFGRKPDTSSFDYCLSQLGHLVSKAMALTELLSGQAKAADDRRFLFLEGRAGSGKSHFLAAEVGKAIDSGAPCLFLLGTDFQQLTPLERQFEAHLGLPPASFDTFLGALDSRAEAAGQRGLIVVDAINEGSGAELWQSRLKAFVTKVRSHPNLALCLSCRTEFVPYLFSETMRADAATVEIRGFQTFHEQEEAARIYMDRRGIVRPAAPRLDPEFSNPLFLRTACTSLAAEGQTQFPLGLRGTRMVLDFFLWATARHLGTAYDGSGDLVAPTQQAMLGLAALMADARKDFAGRREAAGVIDRAFESFPSPAGRNWLDVLQKNGLVRFDPNPANDPSASLALKPEVVRFSFQRFQDHLMAEALLAGASSAQALFGPGEPFEFLFSGADIPWVWRGLYHALHIQVADRWGLELPDILPFPFAKAWRDWTVQDAFVESVRFRGLHAFSPRARELLGRIDGRHSDQVALVLELAVIEGHPWNAEFLHRVLRRMQRPDRDRFWTLPINEAQEDPAHPLNAVIDWSAGGGVTFAGDRVLICALIVLAWAGASTSKTVRDRAAKAMTAVLLERPQLAEDLVEAFEDCDDPYVTERIWAALYGACLRDGERKRLARAASLAWTFVFKSGPPPVLLLRDYARAIVELASQAEVLDPAIDLTRCRPPYETPLHRLRVNEAALERRAERVGASSILYSCYQGIADFGRYVIEGRVEAFANARLTGPKPVALRTVFEGFEAHLQASNPEAFEALALFRSTQVLQIHVQGNDEVRALEAARDAAGRIVAAERRLFDLLTPVDRRRFEREARPYLEGRGARDMAVPGRGLVAHVDEKAAKLWVANRAIALGWTNARFPFDDSYGSNRTNGSKIERIGKKYQRIAFSELLARLADTYWIAPDWSGPARVYDTPLDIAYVRDIDPSVLPRQVGALVPTVPRQAIKSVPDEQLAAWVGEKELCPRILDLALCKDLPSADWVALYRYASDDVPADGDTPLHRPTRQSEFHFLQCLLVRQTDKVAFLREARTESADFHEWLAHDETDGPYVGELGRRPTWTSDGALDVQLARDGRTFKCLRPTQAFLWESHLDGSLPDGLRLPLPIADLLQTLDLVADRDRLGVFNDGEGRMAICAGSGDKAQYLVIRPDLLNAYARFKRCEPVWTVIGERLAWRRRELPHKGSRVRFNGMLWSDGRRTRRACWSTTD